MQKPRADSGDSRSFRIGPLEIDSKTSRRLAQIRQRGTEPELIIRGLLRRLGLRYRTSNRSLPGSPDLANRKKHWAIFVNGCFWHHHKGCRRATIPRRNRPFWVEKFRQNRARDARAVRSLRGLGFRVMIVWECEALDSFSIEVRIRESLNLGRPI
jgi:DNA mismatch endonuclease, patch repair protein